MDDCEQLQPSSLPSTGDTSPDLHLSPLHVHHLIIPPHFAHPVRFPLSSPSNSVSSLSDALSTHACVVSNRVPFVSKKAQFNRLHRFLCKSLCPSSSFLSYCCFLPTAKRFFPKSYSFFPKASDSSHTTAYSSHLYFTVLRYMVFFDPPSRVKTFNSINLRRYRLTVDDDLPVSSIAFIASIVSFALRYS